MGDNFGHLAYLVLLLVAVGGFYLGSEKLKLGALIKMALIWVGIFAVVAIGYTLFAS